MCSSNSIVRSTESERRWVHAMEKILPLPPQHIDVGNGTGCSVFTVPTDLREDNPEAYAPRHVGLGPYHHLHPHLYTKQHQKLAQIRNYLSLEKLHNFPEIVEHLILLEPTIRATYDQHVDLDMDTLAWILAIDGLYLLHFLKSYSRGEGVEEDAWGDIMMLENQIPVYLLMKIQQSLRPSDDPSFSEEFINFLSDQSPLDWVPGATIDIGGEGRHLLQVLHYMIVFQEAAATWEFTSIYSAGFVNLNISQAAAMFLVDQCCGNASTTGQILLFLIQMPWNLITGLLFGRAGGDEQTPLAKIDIPSVSHMRRDAGIKFVMAGRIREIEFLQGSKELHFPVIRITATTEVVLRNLAAYEEASSKPGPALLVSEYVDLMCGIIRCAKDVNILKTAHIIQSQELGDEKISAIFNGISKSSRRKSGKGVKSNVEEAVDQVNKRYNSLAIVKVRAFFKKPAYGFPEVLSVLITIFVVILLVLQVYCSIFGCHR